MSEITLFNCKGGRTVHVRDGKIEEGEGGEPFNCHGLPVKPLRCTVGVRPFKRWDEVVEEELQKFSPSQYFAAIWEDDLGEKVLESPETYLFKGVKATGVNGDLRAYGPVALIFPKRWEEAYEHWKRVVELRKDVTHVVAQVSEREEGKYTISVRAVVTENFMTADVLRLEKDVLEEIADKIFKLDKRIKRVVYDVTPKPPATIEYE